MKINIKSEYSDQLKETRQGNKDHLSKVNCSHEWHGYYGISFEKNFIHCSKCNNYKEI